MNILSGKRTEEKEKRQMERRRDGSEKGDGTFDWRIQGEGTFRKGGLLVWREMTNQLCSNTKKVVACLMMEDQAEK